MFPILHARRSNGGGDVLLGIRSIEVSEFRRQRQAGAAAQQRHRSDAGRLLHSRSSTAPSYQSWVTCLQMCVPMPYCCMYIVRHEPLHALLVIWLKATAFMTGVNQQNLARCAPESQQQRHSMPALARLFDQVCCKLGHRWTRVLLVSRYRVQI